MNPSITTLDKSNSLPLILLNASLYDTQLLVAKVPQQNSLDGTQTGMLVEELVEVLVDVDVLVVVLVEELVVVPGPFKRKPRDFGVSSLCQVLVSRYKTIWKIKFEIWSKKQF